MLQTQIKQIERNVLSAFILFSISPFSLEFQLPLMCLISILIHSENQFYLFLTGMQSSSQRSSHSWDNTAFSEAKRNKSCPVGLLEANFTSKRAALGFRTDPDKGTESVVFDILRHWAGGTEGMGLGMGIDESTTQNV